MENPSLTHPNLSLITSSRFVTHTQIYDPAARATWLNFSPTAANDHFTSPFALDIVVPHSARRARTSPAWSVEFILAPAWNPRALAAT